MCQGSSHNCKGVSRKTRSLAFAAGCCCIWVLFFCVGSISAHPIPERLYDRSIKLHLSANTLRIDYTLQVDSQTVVFDLADLIEKTEIPKIQSQEDVFVAFRAALAPRLVNQLIVFLDGKELSPKPIEHRHAKTDHVRFDFRFEVKLALDQNSSHRLRFLDQTYVLEGKGWIRLSFESDQTVKIEQITEPEQSLREKSVDKFAPGEESKARKVEAQFRVAESETPSEQPESLPPSKTEKGNSLFDLLLEGDLDLWVLALALFVGAGHALTPGHGKTLVAAYLVGERGTIGHALILGIVTTLTHTGAVLLVAAILPLLFPSLAVGTTQFLLELGAGLLVFGLGLWLLMRRAAGKADHVHIGGGHHHHHDHDHAHSHHHHHHPKEGEPVRMWNLIVLGVSGGIVPCPEAIALLAGAIRLQRRGMALPLLLAFSAGLALVLIAVGMSVVASKKMTSKLLENRGWAQKTAKIMPILSAVVITILGIWMLSVSLQRSG